MADNTPSSWTDADLRAAVIRELKAANSSDDLAYWLKVIRQASVGADWPYWVERIRIGDGAGKGYPGWPDDAPPVPQEPPAQPHPDETVARRLDALEAAVRGLNDQQARQQDSIGHVNDAVMALQQPRTVTVSGRVSWQDAVYGKTLTWKGKVD